MKALYDKHILMLPYVVAIFAIIIFWEKICYRPQQILHKIKWMRNKNTHKKVLNIICQQGSAC